MATAAASITLNFEELQKEIQAFNELFGLWTEQRRRALVDDKEAYLRTVSEEQDTVEALKKQHQQLVQQKQQIQEMLEAEHKEREEYARQNEEYAQQRENLKQKLAIVKRETEIMEIEIMKESKTLEARNRTREINREQRLQDLNMYREKLGITVCPTDSNPSIIQVVFTRIDPKNPAGEFRFCIDTSDSIHLRPCQFSPALPSDKIQAITARGDADFFRLLPAVRAAFQDCL